MDRFSWVGFAITAVVAIVAFFLIKSILGVIVDYWYVIVPLLLGAIFWGYVSLVKEDGHGR